MFVGIYDKQMVKFDGKRDRGQTGGWEITPFYAEKLEMMIFFARPCLPKRAYAGLLQVASGDHTYEISLENRSCSCRKWDLCGLSCNHDISAIYKAHKHPEDFVSDFFKSPCI
jgi:hypothetical protein